MIYEIAAVRATVSVQNAFIVDSIKVKFLQKQHSECMNAHDV